MATISKKELISNLKDKISQFKSNYSKNKESRKDTSDFNFEINRDALKHFYKNKSQTNGGEENSQEPKEQNNIKDIYDIKKILDEKQSKPSFSNNVNKNEKEEKKVDIPKQENKNNEFGGKIQKNFTFGRKDLNEEEINQNEKRNELNKLNSKKEESKESLYQKNDNLNANSKISNDTKNYKFDNNNQNSNFNFEYKNYKFNQKNNVKDNNTLEHITLHNYNYNDFNIENIMKNKKEEKREKSAPKINVNQKLNNYYIEKPLTDKNNQNYLNNIKKINYTTNYNTNNEFNVKKPNKTEELYQKLLDNFNINSNNKNVNNSFYNFNSNNNINKNYNKENNPNKSYGQINIKDINLLYEINSNNNSNNYNQKKNYFRNELNLDHLKDLYSKKTEEIPSQTNLKVKMDLFYKELNDYKKSNNYQNQMLKNYYTNDKYLSDKYSSNTQYNQFIRNSNNNSSKSKNYLQNFNFNEHININNNININDLSYNEIHAFKLFLKDLSKEEMNNLPYNVKSELKDILNILYKKFNE